MKKFFVIFILLAVFSSLYGEKIYRKDGSFFEVIRNADIFAAITRQNLVPQESLLRCDAEPLLVSTGGAIRIGPTGTNVADIRLLLIRSKD